MDSVAEKGTPGVLAGLQPKRCVHQDDATPFYGYVSASSCTNGIGEYICVPVAAELGGCCVRQSHLCWARHGQLAGDARGKKEARHCGMQ